VSQRRLLAVRVNQYGKDNNMDTLDRVILVTDRHDICDYNPMEGSEWACTGTIVDYTNEYDAQNPITVEWDNGTQNVYNEQDLELENTNGYRCKTIW
jgi:hypothetical protein